MRTNHMSGPPDLTIPPAGKEGSPGHGGHAGARLVARPGIAIAASAPIVMVAVSALPAYRPADLIPCLLGFIAAAVLVMASELASFDRGEGVPQSGALLAIHNGWSDPAMVSVDRWLAHWPGVAGVSAISWWAARTGAAGLLSALAFSAAGVHNAAIGAGAVVCLALLSLVPGSRHAVHLAVGVVALTGLLVTGSGIVALARGQLTTPMLPSGPLWPTAGSPNSLIVQVASTIALLCLGAVCLLAVTPATSGGARGKAKWFIWGAVGTAVGCWIFAVPLLLRMGGLNFVAVLVNGSAGALQGSLAAVVEPLAGSNATAIAGWVLGAACLAGALGALSGGTSLARSALGASNATRAGRHGQSGLPGLSQNVAAPRAYSRGLMVVAAAASGLVASAVALLGPRGWLLIALGGLATGALALTTLAPPVLRQCQRVPGAVRVVVTATWVLVATVAVGNAGPLALAIVGLGSLAGAFMIGWRGLARTATSTTKWRGLPWGTAAATLVTATAVTTLELLPTGTGPGGSAVWRGLAVVVMGAGIVLLAVFPATSRLRVEHLCNAASTLAEKTLPALAKALEAVAIGELGRVPMSELSDLRAAARPLEAELSAFRPNDGMLVLTKALVDASNQVLRLASGVEAVARLDGRRLAELVEEQTAVLSHANRNLVDSQWRRGQLLDRTVRAAEGERTRVAANLHDGPIQRLAALGLVLDRCRLRLDRDDNAGARELMKRARNELSEEIQSLREMMSELRPPILDEGGLDAALQDQLSNWASSTGLEARFEGGPHGPLNPNSETVIYRVVQEALANVAKHARASLATVSVTQSGSSVEVVIRDNGKGFNAGTRSEMLRHGHFGLVVMRERVEWATGRFEIKSAPLTGTEVTVWLPINSTSEPIEAA